MANFLMKVSAETLDHERVLLAPGHQGGGLIPGVVIPTAQHRARRKAKL